MKTLLVSFCILFLAISSCTTNSIKRNAKINRNRIETLMDSANQNYYSGSYYVAVKYYDSIIRIDTTLPEAFFHRGYALAQCGKNANSNKDFQIAISMDYKIEKSNFNIGCNYIILQNYGEALKYLKKAYEMNPKNQKAKELIEVGEGLLKTKKNDL
jgi:tetratricopeptide (TPR) repeat protein